jgi:serine/threonine protein kinase, bacterial
VWISELPLDVWASNPGPPCTKGKKRGFLTDVIRLTLLILFFVVIIQILRIPEAFYVELTLFSKSTLMTKNNYGILKLACLVIISSSISFSSCKKSSPDLGPPINSNPTIDSLKPSSGSYSTPVVISGKGFSATPSQDSVYFNGVQATVTSATTTQLQVVVPSRAGTGNVTIKVNGTTIIGPLFTFQYTASDIIFAGNGDKNDAIGQGTEASFFYPTSLAMDQHGNLWVAEAGGAIRTISPSGMVENFALNFPAGFNPFGNQQLNLQQYLSLALDTTTANLYIADPSYNTISAVNTVTSTIIPGLSNNLDPDSNNKIPPYSVPIGIYAGHNSLYVSNYGNNYIQNISQDGVNNALDSGGMLNEPAGLCVDANKNIYVANYGGNNILKITPAGNVSVFAGSATGVKGSADGTGTAASFFGPTNIVVDGQGNLYVADTFNQRLRFISPSGVVTTFPAVQFSWIAGLAVNTSGSTLFVSDAESCLVYEINFN